jgi:hypothetical protein
MKGGGMQDRGVEYLGRCHCGALSVRYRTALPVEAWSVRADQCSFCRAHAALSTSDPAGSLAFAANDAVLLQRYRFGLRTADFLICRCCGVYVGAVFASAERRFGVFNIRVLRPMPEGLPAAVPVSYEGETAPERAARRAVRWTPLDDDSL